MKSETKFLAKVKFFISIVIIVSQLLFIFYGMSQSTLETVSLWLVLALISIFITLPICCILMPEEKGFWW